MRRKRGIKKVFSTLNMRTRLIGSLLGHWKGTKQVCCYCLYRQAHPAVVLLYICPDKCSLERISLPFQNTIFYSLRRGWRSCELIFWQSVSPTQGCSNLNRRFPRLMENVIPSVRTLRTSLRVSAKSLDPASNSKFSLFLLLRRFMAKRSIESPVVVYVTLTNNNSLGNPSWSRWASGSSSSTWFAHICPFWDCRQGRKSDYPLDPLDANAGFFFFIKILST